MVHVGFLCPSHREAEPGCCLGHPLPLFQTGALSLARHMVCRQFPGKRFFYVCAVMYSQSRGLLLYNKTRRLGINTEMLQKMLWIIFITRKCGFQLRNIFFSVLKWREQFSGLGTGTEALCSLWVNITQRTGHNRLGRDELHLAMTIMVYVITHLQASILCHLCAEHFYVG